MDALVLTVMRRSKRAMRQTREPVHTIHPCVRVHTRRVRIGAWVDKGHEIATKETDS